MKDRGREEFPPRHRTLKSNPSVGRLVLTDAFGRPFRDLRISVTERCNFRCVYCHNEGQGVRVRPPHSPHDAELSPVEIERIVDVAVRLGADNVKLTGGEPLVRPDLEEIVERCARHAPVSLTTNGSMLEGRAGTLAASGLTRCNVSVDSLVPRDFAEIRGGDLAPVLRGVQAALDAGLTPLKLNMVLYRETVKHLDAMLAFVAEREGLELQLIQFMPEMAWQRPFAIPIHEVRGRLEREADRVEVRDAHHRRRYLLGRAWVELVDPVGNAEFCQNCHRIRVTADGHLKGCINRNDDRVSVRGLDEAGIEGAFRKAVGNRVPFYGVHAPQIAMPLTR